MSEVLLAGGTGFVGANTARLYADAGIRVVVTTRKKHDPVAELLKAYSALIAVETVDLSKPAEVYTLYDRYNFEGVVLLAQTHQHAATRTVINSIYDIVLNCLEGARSSGVKRCVLVSSVVVYGGELPPFTEDKPFSQEVSFDDERVPLRVAKFEITVKRVVEQIVLDYGRPLDAATSATTNAQRQHELETIVLRVPGQFGPGYSYMGNPLGVAAHAAAGKLDGLRSRVGYLNMPIPQLWNLFGLVPPLYVKDTASAIKAAMDAKSLPHRIYNVTSGFTNSSRKQLKTLLEIVPNAKGRLDITPEELSDAEIDVGFNANRIQQDLGWRSGYTLKSAYQEYIDWLGNHDF